MFLLDQEIMQKTPVFHPRIGYNLVKPLDRANWGQIKVKLTNWARCLDNNIIITSWMKLDEIKLDKFQYMMFWRREMFKADGFI